MASLQVREGISQTIEAILWDKDGTLADSHPFLQELAWRRSHTLAEAAPGIAEDLLAAFGCAHGHYDPTGLMAVGTRYENEVAAAAYVAATGRSWVEALRLTQTAFAESDRAIPRKAEFTPPFADMRSLLERCHEWGLKMAVLSGDTTANIQDFLACYDLNGFISWTAGSEAPPIKPDPQMVWRACDVLRVKPERCLVIGDSALDFELARKSGSGGYISVTWGGSPAIAQADIIMHTPSEMMRWLSA